MNIQNKKDIQLKQAFSSCVKIVPVDTLTGDEYNQFYQFCFEKFIKSANIAEKIRIEFEKDLKVVQMIPKKTKQEVLSSSEKWTRIKCHRIYYLGFFMTDFFIMFKKIVWFFV